MARIWWIKESNVERQYKQRDLDDLTSGKEGFASWPLLSPKCDESLSTNQREGKRGLVFMRHWLNTVGTEV